ncbi:zinc-binding dehydrogenase [Sporolactobacillus shoreicorticis]|uniref:Zinc-binding dehydrogenase n=1 Tax=Sporolactobacillus shoreicorticis TaxID=1923877 RepID=A0ABW5S2U0_9BACL|nr:zinc-binding dehydrogenase [Sporolactobacillus shoreicorticis]MCO7125315.1 zinc-binding dehydrogenase [Sporolactobacillus shoreicorticis]
MKGIITHRSHDTNFSFKDFAVPTAKTDEAIIEVTSVSINPGNLKNALTEKDGYTPGWDFSGIIVKESLDGNSPKVGDPVIGMLTSGAWKEQIVVPNKLLSVVSDDTDLKTAAALPIVGLTALYALQKGNFLLNKNILITGSTGGVGYFAHQLAHLAGANHYGVVRNPDKQNKILKTGAKKVYLYSDFGESQDKQKFDLIIDSLGGDMINILMQKLYPYGKLISVGNMLSDKVVIDYGNLLNTGGRSFERFYLGEEIKHRAIKKDLKYLSELLAQEKIDLDTLQFNWKNINEITKKILHGSLKGKVILNIKE